MSGVIVSALLLLACVGAGRTLLTAGVGGGYLRTVGVTGLTGLSLLTGLAGWLVLASAWSASAGWVLLGLCSGALAVSLFRDRAAGHAAPAVRHGAPVIAPGLGLLSLAIAVSRVWAEFELPVVNVNDDLPAYWHFPRLLLESGGFVEPFNIRRLVTLGAAPLLHSFFWKDFGIAAAGVVDALLGQLLIWAAARAIPDALSDRPQPAWHGEAFGLAALLLSLAVPRANSMPALLPLGGALVLLLLTRRISETREGSDGIRAAIAWGLVAAWLVGLRVSNAPFPAALWLAGVLVALIRRDRQQWWQLLVAALATLAGLLPWSLALWRSSGTPLFPLIPGNYDPGNLPPVPLDLPAVLDFALSSLWTNHLWFILAIGAAAALRPGLRLLSIQTGAALLVLVTVTALMADRGQAVDSYSIHRYSAPFLVAGLILFAGTILGGSDPVPAGRLRTPVLAVGLLLWLIVPVDLRYSTTDPFTITNLGLINRGAVTSALSARAAWRSDLTVRDWPGRANYEAAQASLPPDARLVSASETPFFFRFDRQAIHTLDIPGLVSPAPGMPSFEGPEPVAAYLRALGYTHLAFTPGRSGTGLYSEEQWLKQARDGTLTERNWARHLLSFMQNAELLKESYTLAYQSADLVVIDLRRPL